MHIRFEFLRGHTLISYEIFAGYLSTLDARHRVRRWPIKADKLNVCVPYCAFPMAQPNFVNFSGRLVTKLAFASNSHSTLHVFSKFHPPNVPIVQIEGVLSGISSHCPVWSTSCYCERGEDCRWNYWSYQSIHVRDDRNRIQWFWVLKDDQ